MVEQGKCPQCGKAVPSDTPQGLCPACLLRRGLETNTIGDTGGASGARWTPPAVEELAPLFPELDIIALIGRGGMGAVYKAREKQLDRLVALKILPPEIGRDDSLAKTFAQRFAREAQAMAKLSHPNVVTIYSFGSRELENQGTGTSAANIAASEPVPVSLYFFIMEYVDGLSLRQLLDAGTVSPKEALAIVPQICDALQYAHDRGIVHRDIKPENILLNRAGQVKIADFGLAKLIGHGVSGTGVSPVSATAVPAVEETTHGRDAHATHGQDVHATQEVMGTPQYMAPEQIERPCEVDHRADIYSLGVVFYQMLTGELPVGRFEPPSRKVLIDVRLDEVVLRALEREPSRRYQQVSEVKTQVETIVGTPVSADTSQALSPDVRITRIEPWHRAVAVVARRNGKAVVNWRAVRNDSLVAIGLLLLVLALAHSNNPNLLRSLPVVLVLWLAAFVSIMTIAIYVGLKRTPTESLIPLDSVPAKPALAAEKHDANKASSPDNEDATRAGQPTARRASLVPALWAIMIHAVAFGAILAVLVFVVPKCEATFSDMGMKLSQLTRATIAASHIACEWSFVVFPMFLLLDACVCLLLQYFAGPRARRWWSAILALTAAVMITTLGLGVGLAYARVTQTLVRSADTSSPTSKASQVDASGSARPAAPQPAKLWGVTLPDGVTVEMIGVSENPSDGRPWWRPDGSSLSQRPYSHLGASVTPGAGERGNELAIRLTNLPKEDVGTRWEFVPPTSYAGGGPVVEKGDAIPQLLAIAAITRTSQDAITVKLGVAAGAWTTLAEASGSGSSSRGRGNVVVSFSPAHEKDNAMVISVAHNVADQDIRVVAVDIDGKELKPGRSMTGGAGNVHQLTCTFYDVRLSNIKEFRLQARPYEWAEFKNVSLTPGTITRPTTVVATQPIAADKQAKAVDSATEAQPTACPLGALVYEVRVPADKIAQFDANALAAAAGPAELEKTLSAAGQVRLLYRMDQSVKLSGEQIGVQSGTPMVFMSRLSELGETINTVQYTSVGVILKFAGKAVAGGIDATLDMEMTALAGDPTGPLIGSGSSVMLPPRPTTRPARPTTRPATTTTRPTRSTTRPASASGPRPARTARTAPPMSGMMGAGSVIRKPRLSHRGLVQPGKPVVLLSVSGTPDANGLAVAYVARIVLGSPRVVVAPADEADALTCPLDATVFELRLPPGRLGQFSPAALGNPGSTDEFAKALARFGQAKTLYRMNQSVRLSGDRIRIDDTVPVATSVRPGPTKSSSVITTVDNSSVGVRLNVSGSPRPGGAISAAINLELSTMSDSQVNITETLAAKVWRTLIMACAGESRPGEPIVIATGDGASLDANGQAVAYFARIVLGKPAAATQPASAKAVADEFYVMGEVDRPGAYPLAGREITVKMALAGAGFALGKKKDLAVVLIRRLRDGSEQQVVLSIDALIAGGQQDVLLRNGDVVAVRPVKEVPGGAAAQPASQLEVWRLREEIWALEQAIETETYTRHRTEKHPTIMALRERIASVRERLAKASAPASQLATQPIAADKQAKAVAEAEKIAQRWIEAWKNRQWQAAWALMLPSETAGKTLEDAWLAEVPGLISQAQLRAAMGDILDVTSYPPVHSERLGSIGVPVVSCKYLFRLNPPVGAMVNQIMTVLLCEEDGNWGVKSWALSAVQATTQPASGPAQPTTATAKGKDPEAVRELALSVLRAIKEDDLATLKSLSAGSRQGWLEVDWRTPYQQGKIKLVGEPPVGWSENDLKSVTAEIRRDVLSRNPDAATKVLDTLVRDDWAATLSPVTSSQYLVMVFVKTDGGWRFATLDQSKGNLADDLAKHMANIPANLKVLRQLDHSSASQPATSTSSEPAAGLNRGAPMSQPSTFPATGPATQPAP